MNKKKFIRYSGIIVVCIVAFVSVYPKIYLTWIYDGNYTFNQINYTEKVEYWMPSMYFENEGDFFDQCTFINIKDQSWINVYYPNNQRTKNNFGKHMKTDSTYGFYYSSKRQMEFDCSLAVGDTINNRYVQFIYFPDSSIDSAKVLKAFVPSLYLIFHMFAVDSGFVKKHEFIDLYNSIEVLTMIEDNNSSDFDLSYVRNFL